MSAQVIQGREQDGRRDFDFLIGRWAIHNRRLRERLKGSQEWEEFSATSSVRMVLDGLGNIDEIALDRESGRIGGMTLRIFNPGSRQWSIYWADTGEATLQKPVVGEFKQGRGEFYSQEPFEGRSIFCRFIWTVITPDLCLWEQAFSDDGGVTWETNWTMECTRLE